MDPAADLGVTLAVASALLDKVVAHDMAILGEVGLSAEVRSVAQIASRVNEAQKLGFTRCIIPKNNLKNKSDFNPANIKLIPVTSVREGRSAVEIAPVNVHARLARHSHFHKTGA